MSVWPTPLWGAPRIHGELLKLGIEIGQTTVAKYMAKERRPPSQGWRTFISNHAEGIAALDLFVVPTISFRLLFGLLMLFGPRDCLGRAPPSPSAALLCELLQSEPNTPVLEQGCADEATSSHSRQHRSDARPWRPASSLRSYLISDRDRMPLWSQLVPTGATQWRVLKQACRASAVRPANWAWVIWTSVSWSPPSK